MTDDEPADDEDGESASAAGPDETWEAVARRCLQYRVHSHRYDVTDALHAVADRLHDGDPITEDDVQDVRTAIAGLQDFLERELVELATGDAEPWHGSVDHVPKGALADALGVTMDDVNAIRSGRGETGESGDGS